MALFQSQPKILLSAQTKHSYGNLGVEGRADTFEYPPAKLDMELVSPVGIRVGPAAGTGIGTGVGTGLDAGVGSGVGAGVGSKIGAGVGSCCWRQCRMCRQ